MQKQSISDSYYNQHRVSNVNENCIVCNILGLCGCLEVRNVISIPKYLFA